MGGGAAWRSVGVSALLSKEETNNRLVNGPTVIVNTHSAKKTNLREKEIFWLN